MKLRALSNLFSFSLLLTSLTLIVPSPANAATIGTAPCVQTIDITAGVAVYQDGNSCFVAFKTVGTYSWTPPIGVSKVDLLVVAGGGGGGARHAGGGGAGGLINSANSTINTSALSVIVGTGGSGGAATGSGGNEGANGNNSQVSGGGITTLTAIGGGGGAYGSVSGSGGSGGGGGCCGVGQGTATVGQGNIGSVGATSNPAYWVGGGGGGAGSTGGVSSGTSGGAGGSGLAITWITSSAQSNLSVGQFLSAQTFFAGGGGGGTDRESIAAGSGGTGGGGAGSNNAASATNGLANTGGGGGGSGLNGGGAGKGGDGGSGVVVIRYSISTFTNSASFSIAENMPTSTNAATITVSESSTITIRATLDYTFFNIVASDSVTARVRFIASPDYEAFADSGGNNEYDLSIRATNTSGNFTDFAIKISLTDVVENGVLAAPTLSDFAFKGRVVTISIISNTPGKIRFFVAGKRIPSCLAQSTTGNYPNYTATCSWKPSISGIQRLHAVLTPTNNAIAAAISSPANLLISKRSNTR
jgi:hypothetical protein